MEHIKTEVIEYSPTNIVSLGTNSVEFTFPSGVTRWTITVLPKIQPLSVVSNPTVDVKYWVKGQGYFSTNPATSATAIVDKANIITREDAVSRIKIDVTQGVTPIDNDLVISLSGTRVSQ